ncbi:XkdX family protein [Enterococcus faecalis 13-SD-W-01]|nr:XkdX family protein [Enterococcus faecalis 13-SD-W-01]
MFSYDQIKQMYDWDCFTDEQVKKFVPLCITEEEAEQIINKEESTS